MTAARAQDDASIAYFGQRSQALGFPRSGLSTIDADLQPFADAVRDRYGRIVNRLTSVAADIAVDAGWLEHLVALDLGDHITFTRRGIEPERTLDGFVCGYVHNLTPNNWRSIIYTTTTTRSI